MIINFKHLIIFGIVLCLISSTSFVEAQNQEKDDKAEEKKKLEAQKKFEEKKKAEEKPKQEEKKKDVQQKKELEQKHEQRKDIEKKKTKTELESSIKQKELELKLKRFLKGDLKQNEDYLKLKIKLLKEKQALLEKTTKDPNIEKEIQKIEREIKDQRKEQSYDGIKHKIEQKIKEKEKIQAIKPVKAPPKEETRLSEIKKSLNPEQYAKSVGLDYKDGKTRIVVSVDDLDPITLAKLKQIGKIEVQKERQVQLLVPIDKIEQISQIANVQKSRPPSLPIQHGIITSEGVESVSADLVHVSGLTGNGIKVGVLDLAFDIHNSEIQSNVVESKSFRYDMDGILESVDGRYNEYLHGTAVAEIITDVAPDVSLHLYSFGTELEFADAVDYAIQKVDLIAMSAGWMTFPTDGSTLMTSKVEDSVNSGVPFILSAGNSAEMHWQGNYVDTDGNGWHEFASGDEGISISATADRVSNQFSITAYLMWADLPSDYVNDFDLALIGPEGDIVTHSSNVQSHKDNAFEWISFVPDVVGTYHIGITYSGSGTPPDVLEIFSPTDLLEYHTIPSSVTVPTDADGAIVVGAIYHVDDSLESFSSNGPTNNGNKTPTVVAPDGVTTDAYDTEPFYGTSAAAPHVAGIVALLLEQNPDITPAEILSMLEDNADAESVGLTSTSDNAFGFGKADAYNLIGGSELEIPDWIKNNADWWSQGLIDDDSFVNGIQFMITNGIIVIPDLPESSGSGGEVPDWVRNNAEWWAQNLITDEDFVMGIEFLVKNGIIVV